jgi:hypothetical protein
VPIDCFNSDEILLLRRMPPLRKRHSEELRPILVKEEPFVLRSSRHSDTSAHLGDEGAA